MRPSDTPPSGPLARQQGIAALRAGDMPTARQLLSAAVAQNPADLDAWLWLSGAVSSDGERRYCLLRVQALNPMHPAAARGLAMLTPAEPVSPLPEAPLAPAAALSPQQQDTAEVRRSATTWLPETPSAPAAMTAPPIDPAPVEAPRTETLSSLTAVQPSNPPGQPSRIFWGMVGSLCLVLLLLVGAIVLRVVGGAGPTQPPALAAAPTSSLRVAPTTEPAETLPSPVPATVVPSPTTPPATATSAPSTTPAPPTLEPTAAPPAVVPGDDSAQAFAARGLIVQRRDEDFEGALADYTEAIARNPSYAGAYYLRAALWYEQGEAESAQSDYTRGLQLDSTSAEALYLSGRVEMSRGNADAAVRFYNKALAIDPGYAQAYYSLGVYKGNQNDIEGAIAEYTAAIKADPQFAFAYGNRANLYDDLGRQDPALMQAALSDYAMAIKLEPLYYQAYYNRGYAYRWYLNEPSKALADFEMATKLRPTSAEAFCELGNTRNTLGDPQGGLVDTTQAITLDPEYACAYYTRGRIQNILGRYSEAITDMSRYMELEPNGYRLLDALVERGYAHAQMGDCTRAVTDFSEVIDWDPARAVAYYFRGTCYNLLGDRQAALDDLTVAVDLYRQQGPVDDYDRAVEKLRQVTEAAR